MSDDPNELIKISMEVALKPVTDIAESVIGLAGGDWLTEKRKRNRERLRAETENILHERKIDRPTEPPPTIAIDLLKGAQDEDRDELVHIWAALLARAMDPDTRKSYRRQFAEVARSLEPLDAVALSILAAPGRLEPHRAAFVAKQTGATHDEVSLAIESLRNLGLIQSGPAITATHPGLLPLGRAFLAAVSTIARE
ncbi:MAG TPA: Abi-alpha family protein [Rhizomicrobium sp.]|jgi:hypothetical protein